MNSLPPTILIESVPADWLAPTALVVGFLQLRLDGLSFRSLVPNPDRAFTIAVEEMRGSQLSNAAARMTSEPRVFEVLLRDTARAAVRFLVADPRACALAIDHALAAYAARTAYR